jgi:hypothetical protein
MSDNLMCPQIYFLHVNIQLGGYDSYSFLVPHEGINFYTVNKYVKVKVKGKVVPVLN